MGLTITEVEAAKTYTINGLATGDATSASVVNSTTVRLFNKISNRTSDYTTASAFSDFSIGAATPTDANDAVAKINAITNFKRAGGAAVTTPNLFANSEEFNLSSSLSGIRPFGSGSFIDDGDGLFTRLTAERIVEDNNNTFHFLRKEYNVTDGVQYTFSCYVKPAGRTWVYLNFVNPNNRVWFDIQNGVIGNQEAGVAGSISNAENGWFRISVTRTNTGTANRLLDVVMATGNGSTTYPGDNTSGVYLFGAMLNEGTLAPYKRTL